MNKNSKIAVYYIVTGDYKILFPDFLESLQNFFPDNIKIVKLISDGLEEFRNYKKNNVIVDLCPRINHYPWPVVAIYKMYHIKENFDDTCEFSCYFNGNALVNIHDENVFDLNKITCSYHSFCGKKINYNLWQYININPNSSAYLENDTYEYVQSGFFFGPSSLIYKMCNDVCKMLADDMAHHLFAQWHDESYFNKWCVLNSSLVDKKYLMTVYKNDVDDTRFIYLRDKRDYGIKK